MARSVEERFWSYVEKRSPDECWHWLGAGKGDRAKFWREGRMVQAYRFAWEITNGPVPAHLQVCHHCDNPVCVNPAHLFVGTQGDNMRDAAGKGRTRSPSYKGMPGQGGSPPGSGCHLAKLTENDVCEIRSSKLSNVALARLYDVTKSNIRLIRLGRTWKHMGAA